MRSRVLVFTICVIFATGFLIGSAARHFVWNNHKRYEILPWLYPKPEVVAHSLFMESICGHEPGMIEIQSLLEQGGYKQPSKADDDGNDQFSTEVTFQPPLRLSDSEFGIEGWEVSRYFWMGDSGGVSGIEVRQPLNVVAAKLHIPESESELPLRIRTSSFSMISELGVQLKATKTGTEINCQHTDG